MCLKQTKEELLSSLLENADENKITINEVARIANKFNEAIRIIKKPELLLK